MSMQVVPQQDESQEQDILDALSVTAKTHGPNGERREPTVIQKELDLTSQVNGRVDTLRNTILTFVAEGKWDLAMRELHHYQDAKSHEQSYDAATTNLFEHCIETIEMIKHILTSQDISILPMAKRYDAYARVKKLFDNTKAILVRLEQIENDLLVKDAKSVTWFLRSLVVSTFVVIGCTAFGEAFQTLGRPLDIISRDVSNWIFNLLGL